MRTVKRYLLVAVGLILTASRQCYLLENRWACFILCTRNSCLLLPTHISPAEAWLTVFWGMYNGFFFYLFDLLNSSWIKTRRMPLWHHWGVFVMVLWPENKMAATRLWFQISIRHIESSFWWQYLYVIRVCGSDGAINYHWSCDILIITMILVI